MRVEITFSGCQCWETGSGELSVARQTQGRRFEESEISKLNRRQLENHSLPRTCNFSSFL